MIKQATKGILTILIISLFIPKAVLAKDKPESNSIDDTSYYSTQDDLTYLYSLFDEGLMDSREIYEMDKMINNFVSNPNKLDYTMFFAIEFELYAKDQELINKF